MALAALLGDTLLLKGGEKKNTAEALAGKQAIGLYFSARGFTTKLAEWYAKDLSAKGLEIVFVSSDIDEDSFKEYFEEQPWLALPFEARDKKAELFKKYQVQEIPSLVILDADGETITKDGREAVSEDPTGVEFPWKAVPAKDLLGAAKIVNGAGNTVALADAMAGKQALALYFSAHWCPPCRGFTPKFAEWYTKSLSSKGLEVVFVSSDKDEGQFKDYFGEMPWLALDFDDRKLKGKLSNAFGVNGIPAVIVLDADLNVVTKEGRNAISADPEGHDMPWIPKPVANLKDGPGNINETPTVMVFCETSDDSEKKALEDALTPMAKKYIEAGKRAGEDPEAVFMLVTDSEELASRIRGMLGLEALPEQPGEAPKLKPRLALLDIPSDGAYYLAPEDTSVTGDAVEAFLADYKAGKLERKQLS